jgi:hypothetical protein
MPAGAYWVLAGVLVTFVKQGTALALFLSYEVGVTYLNIYH